MKALLLSAGLGTRLKPLTDDLPKVMIPLNGKPCLQYHIENLKSQGITDFAINTHYLPKKIKDYFGDGSKFGVNITYSEERPEILGTSGSLNNFRDFFDDTFLVVYADVMANFKIRDLINIHKKNHALLTMALDSKRKMINKGAVILRDNKVTSFIEKPGKEIPGAMINSGFYIVEPEILKYIPEGFSDFGKDILPKLVKEGKLFSSEHKGYIFDIGTLEDLEKAREFLRINN